MPDIAKCKGEGCDKKERCYRYTAEPDEYYQTYGYFDPEGCEYFWEIEHNVKNILQ